MRSDTLARSNVERDEKWRDVIDQMPLLQFPASWRIKIIPPFGGALARFVVEQDGVSVSVYADFYEALGCWSEPHWECYPGGSGENERFLLAHTDALIDAIKAGLRYQKRERARRATPPQEGAE